MLMKAIIHILKKLFDAYNSGLSNCIGNSKFWIIISIFTADVIFSQNNFWQNIELPTVYQGGLHKITKDNSGNLYAVSSADPFRPLDPSILKSTDDGETWFKISELSGWLSDILIDPQNNMYVSLVGNGILRSLDGGITWFHLMPGYNAFRMYLNSTGLLLVYFGGYGLFYSDDLAETWNFLSQPPRPILSITESPNGDYFICVNDSGIYYSTDGCTTWIRRSEGLTAHWYSTERSNLIFVDDTTLLATNSGTDFANEVFKSTNYGETWRKIDLPGYTYSIIGILKDFNNELLLSTKAGGLFKSIDKGSTWTLASQKKCMGLIRTNMLSLIAVNEIGIFKNVVNNKIIWRQVETIRIKPIIQFVSEAINGVIYLKLKYSDALNNTAFYRTSLSFSSWDKIIFPNQYFMLTPSGRIFATYNYNGGDGGYSELSYSTNNGTSWERIYYSVGVGVPWSFKTLDATDEGVVILSLANRTIAYSIDFGQTWSYSDAAQTGNKLIAIKNYNFAFVLRDNYLYLFDLTNNNFTPIQTPFTQASLEYIRYRQYDSSLFAICSEGIFKSTNDGIDWMQIVFEKPQKYFIDSRHSLYYCNTFGEIFGSINSGITWNKIADKPDSTSLIAISGGINGFIFIATQLGFYKSKLSVITEIGTENSGDFDEFRIFQNYPNPFNSNTIFSFYLPHDSNLSLEIYDMIGRKVDEVFSGDLTKGFHQFNWSSDNIASGIYTLKLRASKFSKSNSFIIIK